MKRLQLAIVAVIAALVAAAVLGTGLAASSPAAKGTTVKTAKSRFGIIVDGRGRTLYLFEKDGRRHSACTGACATYWPPLLTSARPVAGTGVKQRLLGTIRRSNGKKQ